MSQALKTADEVTATDATCTRCGITISMHVMQKRAQRGNSEDRCRDCIPRTTPNRIQIPGVKNECNPWSGDVDLDTMQPLKRDGSPYLPGPRICGMADCVNRNHVINAAALEAERHDISYRTGNRRDYFQLLTQLKLEGTK